MASVEEGEVFNTFWKKSDSVDVHHTRFPKVYTAKGQLVTLKRQKQTNKQTNKQTKNTAAAQTSCLWSLNLWLVLKSSVALLLNRIVISHDNSWGNKTCMFLLAFSHFRICRLGDVFSLIMLTFLHKMPWLFSILSMRQPEESITNTYLGHKR